MTTSSKSANNHILIHLADFEQIVELYGPEFAELMGEEFVHRVRNFARPDDILLEISPDKIGLTLTRISDCNHLELAANKLARMLEPEADILGARVALRAKAGFGFSRNPVPTNELIQLSESALRIATTNNLPYAIVEPDTQIAQPDAIPSIAPRFEEALEHGEFQIFFQPKIAASFGNLTGAEALVRWIDKKQKKVIAAGEFIEQIEQTELIDDLTESILRQAISACSKWRSPLSIAVNIPPCSISDARLPLTISDMLSCYELEPQRLILEVTERGELEGEYLKALDVLREIGVKVAIDDFGTGQCSLSYFRDLPADQIKIDQSFVKYMLTSERDKAIIQACILLANNCGLTVVAEGVEDEATAEALKTMGCGELQGYWIGKPCPESVFTHEFLSGLVGSVTSQRHHEVILAAPG